LRQIWKESAYTLTKKDLVERIPEVVKKHTWGRGTEMI
jgi:hypothetical protein